MIALAVLLGIATVAATIIVLRRGMDVIPPGAGVGGWINHGDRPRLRWVGLGAKCIRVTWQDNAARKRSRLISWYPTQPFMLEFSIRGADRDKKWYRVELSVMCIVPSGMGNWAQRIRDLSWQLLQSRASRMTTKGLSQARQAIEGGLENHLQEQGFVVPSVVISSVVPEGR